MNSKEALDHICHWCGADNCPWIHYEGDRCEYYKLIMRDLDRLEEPKKDRLKALEARDTPKPYEIKKNDFGQTIFVCPTCGKVLFTFRSEIETVAVSNFCDVCGQKLDWSI